MFLNGFRARLIFGAAVWVSLGVGVSGFILAALFRDLIIAEFDHDLLDHAEELAGLVQPKSDGALATLRDVSDPRFNPPRSGVYWQVRLGDATIRSPSLESLDLPVLDASAAQRPTQTLGPTGPIRMMQKTVELNGSQQPLRIVIGVEERLIDEAMRKFNLTLGSSLAVLALGLIGAAYAQVEFGLRPLTRIRRSLSAVRSGEVEQLPENLPIEVAPLVTDLNSLIRANREMVQRARMQASNFAHALKTPLTILLDEGRELQDAGQHDAARVIIQQCIRMQRQIDYQTARARTSARANAGAATSVGKVVRNVTAAFAHLRRHDRVEFEIYGPDEVAAACDPEDLSEILGNLVDNAQKWTRSRVQITIQSLNGMIRISVDDDGPGIPPEHFETVFGVGEQLDESMPGSGLGLAITRDLVTLYGGRIWIERSALGGAAAIFELPLIAEALDRPPV